MIPGRHRAACVGVVAGVAGLYAARYWVTWDRFIGAHRDETLWLPLAMRANDGALFATDPLVPALGRFFPRAWVALSAAGLELTADPATFTLLASTILLIVYATGVSVLSLAVSPHALVAAIVGVVSLRPNVDLSGIGWGIFVGNAEPRSFVYAASPWVLAAFLTFGRTPRVLAVLGIAVGALGNLHPPSALHLGALLAGALVLAGPPAARVGPAAALLGGVALGLAPYATQWLRAFEPGQIPMEIVAFRTGAEITPAWSDLAARVLGSFLVPCALAALALWVASADPRRAARRADLVRVAVAAVAGTLTAPLLPLLAPRLFALAPLRLSGYLFLVSLILAGELLRSMIDSHGGPAPGNPGRSSKNSGRLLAAAALAVGLVLTAGGGRVGDVRALFISERHAGAKLWTDASSTAGPLSRGDFLSLCGWARAHTEPSDLFLTPTGGWAPFRIYAARPLFVAYKDGSVVTYVVPQRAEAWYRRLLAVNALYAAFETDAVRRFARAQGIRYVVQERTPPAVDLPIVYENASYRVYDACATC